jgi:F0F1-type ATP synthase assembly protein I
MSQDFRYGTVMTDDESLKPHQKSQPAPDINPLVEDDSEPEELKASPFPDVPSVEKLEQQADVMRDRIYEKGDIQMPENPSPGFMSKRSRSINQKAANYQSLGIGLTIGYFLVASMAIGLGLGWFIDRAFHTVVFTAILGLLGMTLGLVGSLILIIRASNVKPQK